MVHGQYAPAKNAQNVKVRIYFVAKVITFYIFYNGELVVVLVQDTFYKRMTLRLYEFAVNGKLK